jgi:hypothetical protein
VRLAMISALRAEQLLGAASAFTQAFASKQPTSSGP